MCGCSSTGRFQFHSGSIKSLPDTNGVDPAQSGALPTELPSNSLTPLMTVENFFNGLFRLRIICNPGQNSLTFFFASFLDSFFAEKVVSASSPVLVHIKGKHCTISYGCQTKIQNQQKSRKFTPPPRTRAHPPHPSHNLTNHKRKCEPSHKNGNHSTPPLPPVSILLIFYLVETLIALIYHKSPPFLFQERLSRDARVS